MVFTVPQYINGGLNRKTNQKARYWGDAACIAGQGERRCFDSGAKVVCVFVCIAGQYIYGEGIT